MCVGGLGRGGFLKGVGDFGILRTCWFFILIFLASTLLLHLLVSILFFVTCSMFVACG